MKTVTEYRAYAEECRALSRQMDGAHREQLLQMARTWDKLAADMADAPQCRAELESSTSSHFRGERPGPGPRRS